MIRCITIDDEPLALKQMSGYIQQTPFLELAASFESALDALEFLQKTSIDLIFVDINMPDLNGLEFVKLIDKKCLIVFTTAYSEYAIEGFKADAIDYLLKPIGYADFLKAANKAREWHTLIEQAKNQEIKSNNEFLFIKSDYKIVRISLNTIKYIEGMREYVRIHLEGRKPVMSLISMKNLEQQLPAVSFMRVHRSYIVNLNKITTIEKNRILFEPDIYIPISDQYKDQFQAYIDKNFL